MDLSEFYQTLDRLYQEQRISEVESFLAQTADQSIACCGRLSEINLAALNEQGSLYRSLGDYDRSILCFETALAYLAQQYGSESPEYVTTLGNLAGTLRLKGELNRAIETFERCRDILLDNQLDQSHAYLYASTLNNLALVFLEQNQSESALINLAESLQILKTLPGTEMDQAIAQVNLSILHQRLGQFDSSFKAIQEALLSLEKHPEDPHFWAALNQKASLSVHTKDYPAAAAIYQMIGDKLLKSFGKNLDYAVACSNLSRTLVWMNERAEAIESASRAYEAFQSVLGDAHARTRQAQDWLNQLMQ